MKPLGNMDYIRRFLESGTRCEGVRWGKVTEVQTGGVEKQNRASVKG